MLSHHIRVRCEIAYRGKSVRRSLRRGPDCWMADKQWFAVRTIVANNENRPWGPTNLDPGQIDLRGAHHDLAHRER
jgi:hypothetical protein